MNSLGKEGEEIALRYFRKREYRIIERNYRTPFGEIDLIVLSIDRENSRERIEHIKDAFEV
jgi:Holliday junction resolvase-like predicted endonuclease